MAPKIKKKDFMSAEIEVLLSDIKEQKHTLLSSASNQKSGVMGVTVGITQEKNKRTPEV